MHAADNGPSGLRRAAAFARVSAAATTQFITFHFIDFLSDASIREEHF
jgi:hypothetical protein